MQPRSLLLRGLHPLQTRCLWQYQKTPSSILTPTPKFSTFSFSHGYLINLLLVVRGDPHRASHLLMKIWTRYWDHLAAAGMTAGKQNHCRHRKTLGCRCFYCITAFPDRDDIFACLYLPLILLSWYHAVIWGNFSFWSSHLLVTLSWVLFFFFLFEINV